MTGPRQREWSTEGAALHSLFCSLGPRARSTHHPCAKDLPFSLWCSLTLWRHSNEGNCLMVASGAVRHWAPSNVSLSFLPCPSALVLGSPFSTRISILASLLRLPWAFPSQTTNQESPLPTRFISVWLPPRTFYNFLVPCLQPCLPTSEKCQPPEVLRIVLRDAPVLLHSHQAIKPSLPNSEGEMYEMVPLWSEMGFSDDR